MFKYFPSSDVLTYDGSNELGKITLILQRFFFKGLQESVDILEGQKEEEILKNKMTKLGGWPLLNLLT